MKTIYFLVPLKIFLYIIIYAGTIIPCTVYALDVSIGPTMWLTQMDQQYTKNLDDDVYYSDTQKANLPFIGPALAIKFNADFNLTFIYLYAESTVKEKVDTYPDLGYNFKRHDADLALNYKLNDYFKIFAGIKYINYSIHRGRHTNYSYKEIIKRDHYGLGPGLGLSAVFPVVENFFLLANLSGFCLLLNKESAEYLEIGHSPESIPIKPKSNDYGINAHLSLACYIVPASTTISFGGRFQYIRTVYTDRDPIHGSYYNHNTSMFYGVTLTTTYSFNI